MVDVTDFKVRENRISFKLDDEAFSVKYPERYSFGREYLDVAKEFPLCMWANKLAFTKDENSYIEFEVAQDRLRFWRWVAQKVHELDVYQSLSDDFDSDEIELVDLSTLNVKTGHDPGGLVPTPMATMDNPEGALISQSTGKESIASKLICEAQGVEPIESVFIEYSSRAATHKIDTREEFNEYFNTEATRLWSNFNTLQTTLSEYTENYEPITCFWEMAYLTMELPIAVMNNYKYILMGNQLNTGEAMHDPKGRFVTFEELNQSYVFELAYTDYLNDVLNLPIVHTSNVRPFTGYACRKLIAENGHREFLEIMHNCLRPNTHNRWCKKCYKCNNSWVEFLACKVNPEDAGLSHDVLIENPHFAADNEDWGFSFPRYARDEHVWNEEGAAKFFSMNVRETLTTEQEEAFIKWRRRQKERVDQDDYDHLAKFNGKFIEPIVDSGVIPEELINDMGLEHTDFIPDALDPRDYSNYSLEWKQ